ncbi:hypothetical protein HDU76_009751 [Blyttiomyces sp. JEL0837]|nr:hypothetical protein HDU76_009751 [Blyttiomyces sp. JEL0837]
MDPYSYTSTSEASGSSSGAGSVPRADVFGTDTSFDDFDAAEQHLATERTAGVVDLYAVLNLEKDATEEDIKNAYRRLCMTFHPDKHRRQEDKEAAQKQFQIIQKAYDVLSNPGRRHIYDIYGMEGLSTSWEVGTRMRTPEEVREEFERMSRQRLDADAENLIKSKGEILVGFDASYVLDPFDKLPRRRRNMGQRLARGGESGLLDAVRLPELTQAFVRHSWETKLAAQTDLTIQGSALARNGIGAGSVQGTIRHVISPLLWGEVSGTMGQAPSASVKVVKNFSSDIFSTVSTTISTLATPPPITAVLGRRLTESTTGYITYRTGDYVLGPWGSPDYARERSSCAIGAVRRDEKSQFSVDLSVGLAHSSASLGYFRVVGWGVRARCGVAASTAAGLSITASADRKVSKHSRLGMGVEATNVGGVTFRLRFARLGQKFAIPILLTPQMDFQIGAAVLPLMSAVFLDRFVLEPRRKRQFVEKLAQIRAENAEILEQRRQEAEEATNLMKEQVARKREAEESKNGLIIIEALYGKLPPSNITRSAHPIRGFSFDGVKGFFSQDSGVTTPPHLEGRGGSVEEMDATEEPEQSGRQREDAPAPAPAPTTWIDVTVPIQGLVFNSQLHVSGGHSKAHIVGFYDPCLGEAKRLRIVYKFQGKLHQIEVDDTAPVAAPLRAHLISTRPL